MENREKIVNDIWSMIDKPYIQAMSRKDENKVQSNLVNCTSRKCKADNVDNLSTSRFSSRTYSKSVQNKHNNTSRISSETFEAIPEEFRPTKSNENLHEILEKPIKTNKTEQPKKSNITTHRSFDFKDVSVRKNNIGMKPRIYYNSGSSVNKLELRKYDFNSPLKNKSIENNSQKSFMKKLSFPEKRMEDNDQCLLDNFSELIIQSKDPFNQFVKKPITGRLPSQTKKNQQSLSKEKAKPVKRLTTKSTSEQTSPVQVMTWKTDLCYFQGNKDKITRANSYDHEKKRQPVRHIKPSMNRGLSRYSPEVAKRYLTNMRVNCTVKQPLVKLTSNKKNMPVRHEIKITRPNLKSDTVNLESDNITGDEILHQNTDIEKKILQSGNVNKDISSIISKSEIDNKMQIFINKGKEISDLIIGSEIAMNTFLSFYHEWLLVRNKTLAMFEELLEQVLSLKNKNQTVRHIANFFSTGGKMLSIVPDPRASIASKIVTALGSLISRALNSPSNSTIVNKEFLPSLQMDIDSTSDVFIYAIQCDHQFQETCNVIESFYKSLNEGSFQVLSNNEDAGKLLDELSQLNPNNNFAFYKRLRILFETADHSSKVVRAFCGAFDKWPGALSTTSKLTFRFLWICDMTSQRAWEEICEQLQNEGTKEEIYNKIKNSICVLTKERDVIQRNISNFLKMN